MNVINEIAIVSSRLKHDWTTEVFYEFNYLRLVFLKNCVTAFACETQIAAFDVYRLQEHRLIIAYTFRRFKELIPVSQRACCLFSIGHSRCLQLALSTK